MNDSNLASLHFIIHSSIILRLAQTQSDSAGFLPSAGF